MKNILHTSKRNLIHVALVLTLVAGLAGNGWGQTPIGFLDFGTTANGTTATTGNTGFGGVRIGSGGGSFTIMNPGKPLERLLN